MTERLDAATRDALDTLRLSVNLTVHWISRGPGPVDGSSIRDALAHVERALERSRQDVAAAEQRATRAERAERELERLRLRLRRDPQPALDWLEARARALAGRGSRYAGRRGVQAPFPKQVMDHLRERVRLPGDVHPEDIAERHVCPGCHAVDEPCLPGCIDAEIAADRERDREGPVWEDEEDDQ